MNYPINYVPPKIWKWENENGGTFASTNRPIAGSTHDKTLPIGQHPFQLYSQGTPNGIKVTVMFEELLEMGHSDAEYDAWLISIGKGEQFGSDFVNINPNSKIIVLTGYGAIATAVAAVKMGAIDYLSKPADANDILNALVFSDKSKPPPPVNPMSADRVKWEHILRVYELCNRNVSETARRLKMHRRTLQRILQKKSPK